jgi:hypothetical protein
LQHGIGSRPSTASRNLQTLAGDLAVEQPTHPELVLNLPPRALDLAPPPVLLFQTVMIEPLAED